MSDHRRWEVACHEAGHCVAAIVLGGECHSIIVTAKGGECRVDGLGRVDSAFMSAAGPAAERLLAAIPAPELPPAAAIDDQASGSTTTDDGETDAKTIALSDFYLTDDQHLASFAIRGFEHEPERWLGRVYWCRSVAEQIVSDHAAFVVAVATELFLRGSLTAADILQIQNRKEFAA